MSIFNHEPLLSPCTRKLEFLPSSRQAVLSMFQFYSHIKMCYPVSWLLGLSFASLFCWLLLQESRLAVTEGM